MNKKMIKGNLILPGRVEKDGLLIIEGGQIVEIMEAGKAGHLADSQEILDYSGCWVSPGLIDIHLHGARGKEAMDGQAESIREMAKHQAECGVTGFFPTTLTSSQEALLQAISVVRKASQENLPSEVLGIHLEGPYISHKRKGAQDPNYVREINPKEIQELKSALGNLKTLITLAPEAGQNLSYIPELLKAGWTVSLGHTDASYEEALEAFSAGANHATHLFNAWREFHHREPGGIGAALDESQVFVELIADGIHVHPSFIRLAIFRKGVDRVCLITDSLKEVGLPDGTYAWGGLEVVLKGQEIRLKDNGVLAGSALHLNNGVRQVLDWTGLSVPEVVKMATLTPAKSVGLEKIVGSLEPGKRANVAIFGRNFKTVAAFVMGEKVYSGEGDQL
ncbi:MAG: N-acetylglucosamine-6-phosphate deacetylase [Acidobacteriota bacterium]|nr:N-acetylglucosamine-6-phosphate deacetylase [Acidobacteriota bacterium]